LTRASGAVSPTTILAATNRAISLRLRAFGVWQISMALFEDIG
jgi:hypothetical protein